MSLTERIQAKEHAGHRVPDPECPLCPRPNVRPPWMDRIRAKELTQPSGR